MATLSQKLKYVRQRIEQLENKIQKAMRFEDESERRIDSIRDFYVSYIEKLLEDELELKMFKKLVPFDGDSAKVQEYIFRQNLEREFKANKVLLTDYHDLVRYTTNAHLNKMSVLEAKNVMKFYSTKFPLNFMFLLEGTGINTQM